MSEVALQIIGTIGEELQMARDEISGLKKELEDAQTKIKDEASSASFWYKQYHELKRMLGKEPETNLEKTEGVPF